MMFSEDIPSYNVANIKEVQTFSIVAGTMRCNARCLYCVSKMTTPPDEYILMNYPHIDWERFREACDIAVKANAGTVLFTGKGEPALYPQQIDDYLKFLAKYPKLSKKELQTNGLILHEPEFQKKEWLKRWHDNGLGVMCISAVDADNEPNRRLLTHHRTEYPSLGKTADIIHDAGYIMRLSIIMVKGVVDSPEGVERVIDYCKKQGIEQLTMRPVRKPEGETYCPKIACWVEENQLSENQIQAIRDYVEEQKENVEGRLVHKATIYRVHGQNLCLTDCLTHDPNEPKLRQLIFYSNGMLATGWTDIDPIVYGPGEGALQWVEEQKRSRADKIQ